MYNTICGHTSGIKMIFNFLHFPCSVADYYYRWPIQPHENNASNFNLFHFKSFHFFPSPFRQQFNTTHIQQMQLPCTCTLFMQPQLIQPFCSNSSEYKYVKVFNFFRSRFLFCPHSHLNESLPFMLIYPLAHPALFIFLYISLALAIFLSSCFR